MVIVDAVNEGKVLVREFMIPKSIDVNEFVN